MSPPLALNVRRDALVLVAVAIAAHSIVGCSTEAPKSAVTATVTLDGAPLKSGQVRLAPANGDGPTAGATIAGGVFSARVAPGAYIVQIYAPKVVGRRKAYDTPDSPTIDIVEELIPERYNIKTELRLEARPGEHGATFDLESTAR